MEETKINLQTMRHSAEHVLTQAIVKLYPGILMAMGPATKEGFYFDFDSGLEKISESDFPRIEKEMAAIVKKDLPIIKKEISYSEAEKLFSDNPYKLEWLKEIKAKKLKPAIYSTGNEFVDLCSGPHVSSTRQIGEFKLLSIAGAYWHGDEKNKMLTRIYGTSYPTKKELDKFLWQAEEEKKRDHRKLNQTLKLYMISDDIGQGLVTLLPNGAIIAEELEKWAKKTEEKLGYVRVLTPNIASEKVFKQTGHIPHYLENMFPPMRMEEKGEGEKDIYYLKPMNCAGHHMVFKSETRSYRDLPLRIAEYGTVYRYEKSGELHGILRVRGPIHQNDAHIFCTEEQAEEEFKAVMDLHKYYYETLGLSKNDYYLSFAVRDKKNKSKYIGDDTLWEKAEQITLKYVKQTNIPYEVEEGGAAFYGPKIDFNIRTVTGKVFSASTNQLDFFLPRAFGITYADKDGTQKIPVCIHRAPLGSHVRFIAFLTEHFAGAFPAWLAPVQAAVLPISEKVLDYSRRVTEKLKEQGIRAILDDSNETLGKKIRNSQTLKYPYMLIIGEKEQANNTVSERGRSGKDFGQLPLEEFSANIKKEIEEKQII